MSPILIIILSLVTLIFLHELGHFLLAKKYGVRVEEFGIGIPPRLFGKKIGETIYSLNWIPLGGFVKLYGEDRKVSDERSFSSKPLYQRALIVFGGVAAFFVIAFFIFSIQSVVGIRTVAGGESSMAEVVGEPEIVITGVVDESPAKEAGIQGGDILLGIDEKKIETMEDARVILEGKKGKETEIVVQRGGEEVSFSLVPREEYAEGEGAAGIAMATTVIEKYPLYYAPVKGASMTGGMTLIVLRGFGMLFSSLLTGASLPPGMEIGGPVAIVGIGAGAFTRGLSDFLQFLGAITISLAVLNIMPIPALDGGRLVFLAIEKMKGNPISEKLEYGLNAVFFFLLIGLMIFITFRDLGF